MGLIENNKESLLKAILRRLPRKSLLSGGAKKVQGIQLRPFFFQLKLLSSYKASRSR